MNSTAAAGQSGVVAFNVARQPERRPAYPIVRIHLLGSMRATSYLGDDVLPRPKKARAILAYLCFAFGRAVPRARLRPVSRGFAQGAERCAVVRIERGLRGDTHSLGTQEPQEQSNCGGSFDGTSWRHGNSATGAEPGSTSGWGSPLRCNKFRK